MLDVAKQLKGMGAKRVFVFSTFGLFTNGFEKFDKAYEEGLIDRIFTTDLVYQKPGLQEKEWYTSVRMSRYIAALIDSLSEGRSLKEMIRPEKRIRETIQKYMAGRKPPEES